MGEAIFDVSCSLWDENGEAANSSKWKSKDWKMKGVTEVNIRQALEAGVILHFVS
jgi:hypothetical protein